MLALVFANVLRCGHAEPVRPAESAPEALFSAAAARHRSELADVRAQTRSGVPWKSAAFRPDVPLVASTLRERYPKGTAVLFYGHHQDTLSAWVIDADGLRASSASPVTAQELGLAIRDMREGLGVDEPQRTRAPALLRGLKPVPEPASASASGRADASQKLSRLLLPRQLGESIQGARYLIVVPTLGIGLVPFGMLVPEGGSKMLIDETTVSIAPSLYDILTVPPRAKPPGEPLGLALILGIGDFQSDDEWRFPPLPGAIREARQVADVLGTEPFDPARGKAGLLAPAAEADLLYFATHAVGSRGIRGTNDGFLVICGAAGETCRWGGHEIHDQRLRARLAVLSACQTGLGTAHSGGVVHIARSFQIAGVDQVVMSLWSVDDDATVDLMQRFIGSLTHMMPADALTHAMRQMMARNASPAQWAPFVHFGVPRW